MKYIFTTFAISLKNRKRMSSITLKEVPVDLHRTIKMIQFDLEDKGEKKTLPEIYLMLIDLGLKEYQTKKPDK